MSSTEKQFTLDELKKYDGKEGRPAYVAVRGKVYDVTESFLWAEGEHQGEHVAGTDLSDDVPKAPHGDEVLERFKLVGTLTK